MQIYLESYGCTLNHGEARYLKHLLSSGGHTFIDEPEQAELVVLFTCCVIGTTEFKMVRRARYFNELEKPLVVSGCMAVVERDALLNAHPGVHFLKPKEIMRVNDLLESLSQKMGNSSEQGARMILKTDPDTKPEKRLVAPESAGGTAGELNEEPGNSIDSIVPIATGCRGQCTYCITRLARGKLSSYSPEEIVENVKSAVSSGHYEVRLTAQDTACYGYDANTNLAELLCQIVKINSPHEFRLRVGMMNPDSVKPILDDLINSYKHTRVFKFLHIPVQSGSDPVLRAMGRKYTVDEFMTIIDKFRTSLPQVTISTDIIVGYPNETDEQFNQSMELLKRLRPNIVNITRFSARPGTPAAKIKNTLPGRLVKSRSRIMTELRFKISTELNETKTLRTS